LLAKPHVSFQPNEELNSPFATKNSKALASTKTSLKNPSNTTKTKASTYAYIREHTQMIEEVNTRIHEPTRERERERERLL
jgi:hypothetical protein